MKNITIQPYYAHNRLKFCNIESSLTYYADNKLSDENKIEVKIMDKEHTLKVKEDSYSLKEMIKPTVFLTEIDYALNKEELRSKAQRILGNNIITGEGSNLSILKEARNLIEFKSLPNTYLMSAVVRKYLFHGADEPFGGIKVAYIEAHDALGGRAFEMVFAPIAKSIYYIDWIEPIDEFAEITNKISKDFGKITIKTNETGSVAVVIKADSGGDEEISDKLAELKDFTVKILAETIRRNQQ